MFDYGSNAYRGSVIRWLDGDTVELLVDLGQNVCVRDKYRVARIDAPETALRSGVTPQEKAAGRALKETCSQIWPEGTRVWVKTAKSGKFGRWLVELWVPEGEDDEASWFNLNDYLLETGKAVPYGEDWKPPE